MKGETWVSSPNTPERDQSTHCGFRRAGELGCGHFVGTPSGGQSMHSVDCDCPVQRVCSGQSAHCRVHHGAVVRVGTSVGCAAHAVQCAECTVCTVCLVRSVRCSARSGGLCPRQGFTPPPPPVFGLSIIIQQALAATTAAVAVATRHGRWLEARGWVEGRSLPPSRVSPVDISPCTAVFLCRPAMYRGGGQGNCLKVGSHPKLRPSLHPKGNPVAQHQPQPHFQSLGGT